MADSKIMKNVALLGDGAVGKTSLIRRYVTDKYSDEYIQTIGTKVTKKEIILEEEDGTVNLKMMIWDLIGQKGFRYTQSLSIKDMNGILLVCDLTREDSLTSLISYWIPMVLRTIGPVPMIFLGNKNDLVDEHQFGLSEIEELASNCESFGTGFNSFLTSALTGDNVENAFFDLAINVKDFKKKPQYLIEWNVLDINEVSNLTDMLDHIIADFADQFGGIEHATPFIKHQMKLAGLELSEPGEPEILKFIDNLARIESGYKPEKVVDKNRDSRIKLFRALSQKR